MTHMMSWLRPRPTTLEAMKEKVALPPVFFAPLKTQKTQMR